VYNTTQLIGPSTEGDKLASVIVDKLKKDGIEILYFNKRVVNNCLTVCIKERRHVSSLQFAL
jgi:hypothetical protein